MEVEIKTFEYVTLARLLDKINLSNYISTVKTSLKLQKYINEDISFPNNFRHHETIHNLNTVTYFNIFILPLIQN